MATVKIYSTPWCTFCRMAKDFFKSNNIQYTEFDVSADEKARNEMIDRSKQSGVPVIDIDGQLVVGFDKTRISNLLGVK